jgi:hypothetical protein
MCGMSYRPGGVRRDILVGVVAFVIVAAASTNIANLRLRVVAAILLGVTLAVVARQRWGAVAVVAVPFLLPGAPKVDGITGHLLLTLVTLALALLHWDALGRPRIAPRVLQAAALYGAVDLLLTWGHGLQIQQGIQGALIALAGIIFGSCLAANPSGRVAFGWACVPLALLAVAEIMGFHNPWPALVHDTKYITLSGVSGAGRAQSTFGHPLVAGGCLATSAAIMLQSRTRYCVPVTVVLVAGSLSTVSRSAIVGLALALACALVVSDRRAIKMMQSAALILGAVILVSSVPALRASLVTRTFGAQTVSFSDQPVRHYAVSKLEHDIEDRLPSLLLGGGQGSASDSLTAMGGIDSYDIFDDQWITSVYDLGLIPMVLIGAWVLLAVREAPQSARYLGLPAMVAIAAVMLFVDGAGWVSLGWLAWVTFGLSTAPDAQSGDAAFVEPTERLASAPRGARR